MSSVNKACTPTASQAQSYCLWIQSWLELLQAQSYLSCLRASCIKILLYFLPNTFLLSLGSCGLLFWESPLLFCPSPVADSAVSPVLSQCGICTYKAHFWLPFSCSFWHFLSVFSPTIHFAPGLAVWWKWGSKCLGCRSSVGFG